MVAKFIAVIALACVSGLAWGGPKIEHWTLDNGVRVYFVRATELPLVQLRIVFDAASSRDPAQKPGVAAMTNSMLRQGAGKLTADDIASGFEDLGAEFSTDSGRDTAILDLRSLSDTKLLHPALDLLTQIIANPSFPEPTLERERARALIGLSRDTQQPAVIAEKAFMRELYGDHVYAHHPGGTEASMRAITRADLVDHHRQYYTGANAWLALVGNVSTGEAKEIANRVLGGLPKGVAAPALPPVPVPAKTKPRLIPFPVSQSHIRLGEPTIDRADPDYFPLYVGNYTLGGGGLVSRLSDEVREKRGFSYSVYSYFSPLRAPGPFILGLQTKNSQRQEALKVVRKVVADFVANGPTDVELAAAKKNLTGGFPLRLDSNRKIAEQLASIAYYGLPLTYLDDFIASIDAVTADQIRDAFKRRVHPDRLVTVIVGGES